VGGRDVVALQEILGWTGGVAVAWSESKSIISGSSVHGSTDLFLALRAQVSKVQCYRSIITVRSIMCALPGLCSVPGGGGTLTGSDLARFRVSEDDKGCFGATTCLVWLKRPMVSVTRFGTWSRKTKGEILSPRG
jgi:hypothetical protein